MKLYQYMTHEPVM